MDKCKGYCEVGMEVCKGGLKTASQKFGKKAGAHVINQIALILAITAIYKTGYYRGSLAQYKISITNEIKHLEVDELVLRRIQDNNINLEAGFIEDLTDNEDDVNIPVSSEVPDNRNLRMGNEVNNRNLVNSDNNGNEPPPAYVIESNHNGKYINNEKLVEVDYKYNDNIQPPLNMRTINQPMEPTLDEKPKEIETKEGGKANKTGALNSMSDIINNRRRRDVNEDANANVVKDPKKEKAILLRDENIANIKTPMALLMIIYILLLLKFVVYKIGASFPPDWIKGSYCDLDNIKEYLIKHFKRWQFTADFALTFLAIILAFVCKIETKQEDGTTTSESYAGLGVILLFQVLLGHGYYLLTFQISDDGDNVGL